MKKITKNPIFYSKKIVSQDMYNTYVKKKKTSINKREQRQFICMDRIDNVKFSNKEDQRSEIAIKDNGLNNAKHKVLYGL